MITHNLPGQPKFWYTPQNTKDGYYNAFVNDPCTILYDENSHQYYSWMLFRDGKEFPSHWIEMTSHDAVNWKQGDIRLKIGREPGTNFMGGSVIVSNGTIRNPDGKIIPRGHLIYLVTQELEGKRDRWGNTGDSQCGVWYVSRGFGQTIYDWGVFTDNLLPTGDCRDYYGFYMGNDLHFAVAVANHDMVNPEVGVRTYRMFSLKKGDIKKTQTVTADKERPFGCEVPNIVKLDADYWLVAWSDQYLVDSGQGYGYQTSKGLICRYIDGQFEPENLVQMDFGFDAYARRINRVGNRILSTAMIGNWAKNEYDNLTLWRGGTSGVVEYTFDRRNLRLQIVDNTDYDQYMDMVTYEHMVEINLGCRGTLSLYDDGYIHTQLVPDLGFVPDRVSIHKNDIVKTIKNGNVIKRMNLTRGWEQIFALQADFTLSTRCRRR